MTRVPVGVIAIAAALFAQETTRSVWDGVYTEEQAARGKSLYLKQCAGCHGELMSGGEMAPPLAGGEFLANWNGLTVGDLFDRIRTSMPLNSPGKLTRDINADITSYILQFNSFPAGRAELDRRSEVLKQIRVDPNKPEPKAP
jgi:mono/diheme cytochrome c family protein